MATELRDGRLTPSQELTACADFWEDSEASVGFLALCFFWSPFLSLGKVAAPTCCTGRLPFPRSKALPLLSQVGSRLPRTHIQRNADLPSDPAWLAFAPLLFQHAKSKDYVLSSQSPICFGITVFRIRKRRSLMINNIDLWTTFLWSSSKIFYGRRSPPTRI